VAGRLAGVGCPDGAACIGDSAIGLPQESSGTRTQTSRGTLQVYVTGIAFHATRNLNRLLLGHHFAHLIRHPIHALFVDHLAGRYRHFSHVLLDRHPTDLHGNLRTTLLGHILADFARNLLRDGLWDVGRCATCWATTFGCPHVLDFILAALRLGPIQPRPLVDGLTRNGIDRATRPTANSAEWRAGRASTRPDPE